MPTATSRYVVHETGHGPYFALHADRRDLFAAVAQALTGRYWSSKEEVVVAYSDASSSLSPEIGIYAIPATVAEFDESELDSDYDTETDKLCIGDFDQLERVGAIDRLFVRVVSAGFQMRLTDLDPLWLKIRATVDPLSGLTVDLEMKVRMSPSGKLPADFAKQVRKTVAEALPKLDDKAAAKVAKIIVNDVHSRI